MLTLAVVLYATLASDPMGADELPPIPYLDKLIHAVMMGGLLGAIAFDLQRRNCQRNVLTPATMWWLFAAVMAFSCIDEVAQGSMDMGRSYDPLDLVADAVGALVAVFAAPPAIRRVLRLHFQSSKQADSD